MEGQKKKGGGGGEGARKKKRNEDKCREKRGQSGLRYAAHFYWTSTLDYCNSAARCNAAEICKLPMTYRTPNDRTHSQQ